MPVFYLIVAIEVKIRNYYAEIRGVGAEIRGEGEERNRNRRFDRNRKVVRIYSLEDPFQQNEINFINGYKKIMTEEKEPTTPEVEADGVDQEQAEVDQPTTEPAAAQELAEPVPAEIALNEDDLAQVKGAQAELEEKAVAPKKQRSRKNAVQFDQVVSYFAACGRCSYFLAGYRVIHGMEDLETAVDNSRSGWLSLSWNHAMRELLTTSFGVPFNVEYLHYDGCCPECSRHYTYQAGDTPEEASTFRIQISNQRH